MKNLFDIENNLESLLEEFNPKWVYMEDLTLDGIRMAMKEYGRQVRDYTLELASKQAKVESNVGNLKLYPSLVHDWKVNEESILKLKEDKRLKI